MASVEEYLENLMNAEDGPPMKNAFYGAIDEQNRETSSALGTVQEHWSKSKASYSSIKGRESKLNSDVLHLSNNFEVMTSVGDYISEEDVVTYTDPVEGEKKILVKKTETHEPEPLPEYDEVIIDAGPNQQIVLPSILTISNTSLWEIGQEVTCNMKVVKAANVSNQAGIFSYRLDGQDGEVLRGGKISLAAGTTSGEILYEETFSIDDGVVKRIALLKTAGDTMPNTLPALNFIFTFTIRKDKTFTIKEFDVVASVLDYGGRYTEVIPFLDSEPGYANGDGISMLIKAVSMMSLSPSAGNIPVDYKMQVYDSQSYNQQIFEKIFNLETWPNSQDTVFENVLIPIKTNDPVFEFEALDYSVMEGKVIYKMELHIHFKVKEPIT